MREPTLTRYGRRTARVVFSSDRDGGGLFWKAADGTGEVERLLEYPFAAPYGWTAEGRLIFDTDRQGPNQGDVGVLAVAGDRTVDAVLDTAFREFRPALSPDGRWLAYVSNESGQNEIYVRPFPNFDEGKWQVSTAGGLSPVWSPDGQELFYRTAVGLGGLVMAVPVHIEPSFTYDAPQRLFSIANYRFIGLGRKFDISPDGQRFVFLSGGTVQIGEGASPSQLIVVQNWHEELKRLVPVD